MTDTTLTPAQLLLMFKEIRESFKETDRLIKENQKQFRESQQEIIRLSKETDKKFKETDKQFKETDKQFKETDKQFKETDKKINKISGLFSNQWGKLMEALVEPACLKLFKARNIDVTRTYKNIKIKKGNIDAEFDVILANGTEVVVIEVKTDMSVEKVKYFVEKLSQFKTYMPEYADKKIYGAVVGIKYSEQSDKYAYRQGLFILRNSGDYILEIANNENFNPKLF